MTHASRAFALLLTLLLLLGLTLGVFAAEDLPPGSVEGRKNVQATEKSPFTKTERSCSTSTAAARPAHLPGWRQAISTEPLATA